MPVRHQPKGGKLHADFETGPEKDTKCRATCRTLSAIAGRYVAGDGPTYISFDVDGLDPVYAPGTGTPEVGGFTTLEAQMMIRGLRGLDLIGGDVVEVAPPFDPSGNTALVGATMMFEILCVVADAVAARGGSETAE